MIGSSALAASPTFTVDPTPTASYATAHVSGTIDPGGEELFYFFQYSHDPDSEGWSSGSFQGPLSAGSGVNNVSDELAGLKANTEYKLRLTTLATDFFTETSSESPYVTFTTDPVAAPTMTIDPVTNPTDTTAHFSGTINPNSPEPPPASGAVEAGFKVDWHFQCSPECPDLSGATVAAGQTGEGVEANATGLEPNTHYTVTLVGKNAGDPVTAGPVSFTTSAVAPTATTVPAFILEGGSRALLGARVIPKNSATSYWFEYGTDQGYGHIAPPSHADAGSSGQQQFETEEISGLAPATTYHFRVVAESDAGPATHGEDLSFTTPSPAPVESCSNSEYRTGPSANLGECRAYELVSLPELNGSSAGMVNPSGGGVWGPVAADGNAVIWSTDAVLPGIDSSGANDYFVSRRDPGGWASKFVGPPGSKTVHGSFPWFASPDLKRIVWLVFNASIDPSDPDPVDSATSAQEYKDLYREEPNGSFTRLTQGPDEQATHGNLNFSFGGASTDALRVGFSVGWQLNSEAPPGSITLRSGQTNLLVSRDPAGVPFSEGLNTFLGVSADGSVVAFSNDTTLYLSKYPFTESTEVADNESGGAGFEGLSANGSKLLFVTSRPLMGDDNDSSVDLYEYDAVTETLTRISAPSGSPAGPGPGNSDECVPSLPGLGLCDAAPVAMSPDGSRVYFVSPEQLDGTSGTRGAPNLYFHEEGETRFVTTLDQADPDFGIVGGGQGATRTARHIRLTPDGSKLLFESQSRLTAYDNARHIEVYLYDPATSQLTCTSCRPNGAAPSGDASLREPPPGFRVDARFANDPLYLANSDEQGNRIFFQSTDGVVGQDTNGKNDVYEFNIATGVTSLVSTGQGTSNSFYIGNGIDGRDVFIMSAQSLAPQDRSTGTYKVYDARIGGGFAQAAPPVQCEGEGCRDLSSTGPRDASPATSNFSGPGDPKGKPRQGIHHRKKHKKHHRRKHKKHARHGNVNHKRDASRKGRTGR